MGPGGVHERAGRRVTDAPPAPGAAAAASAHPVAASSHLDRLLPDPDVRDRHAIRVAAPASDVFRASKEVTPAEMRLMRVLMSIRLFPAVLLRRRRPRLDATRPLLEVLRRGGFEVLAEDPGREIVIGLIDKPWRLTGGRPVRFAGPDEFERFDVPGHARIATNLLVEPGTPTRLVTETRVGATDDGARRTFRRYWFLIRIGSAGVRRSWLGAIRRRAERSA